MIIQHEKFVDLYNIDPLIFKKLLDRVTNVGTLFNRIDKLSSNYLEYGYSDKQTRRGLESGEFIMKGHLFEIFGDIFLQILGCHVSIGVYNYNPVPSTEDNGVDGYGIGIDGKPLTVQFKFRSDATEELIAEDLKQFGFQSIVEFGVDKDTKTNMVLFTCAKGLHYHTDNEVFKGRIRTIGIKDLEFNCKGFPFWKTVGDMVRDTVINKYDGTIISNYQNIIL